MLDHNEYETAKRCIEATLASADTPPRPAELVYLLAKQGLVSGLASTVMWEMISSGEIAMSTSRRLSLAQGRGTRLTQEPLARKTGGEQASPPPRLASNPGTLASSQGAIYARWTFLQTNFVERHYQEGKRCMLVSL